MNKRMPLQRGLRLDNGWKKKKTRDQSKTKPSLSATVLIFFPTLLSSRTFLRFISLLSRLSFCLCLCLSLSLSLCLASLSKTQQRERVNSTLKSPLLDLPPRFCFICGYCHFWSYSYSFCYVGPKRSKIFPTKKLN